MILLSTSWMFQMFFSVLPRYFCTVSRNKYKHSRKKNLEDHRACVNALIFLGSRVTTFSINESQKQVKTKNTRPSLIFFLGSRRKMSRYEAATPWIMQHWQLSSLVHGNMVRGMLKLLTPTLVLYCNARGHILFWRRKLIQSRNNLLKISKVLIFWVGYKNLAYLLLMIWCY